MAWLSGYDQRIKLTIDNTKIDAALSDFPVTIFFTSTQAEEIFAEFDADSDYMKCAFTSSDGTTQLYAEKELFDDSEQKAIYHVKVISVASGADTDIYYYYDNDHADNTDYIGAINTTAGGNVWDGNFKAVYHMEDATTSTVVDSTSNNKDGTKLSANNPIEATGKVGQGQDFSSDYISLPRIYNVPTELTVEMIFKSDVSDTTQQRPFAYNDANDDVYTLFSINDGTANKIKFGCYDGTTVWTDETTAYTVTNYHHLVGTAKENDYANLFIDGTKIGTPSARGTFTSVGTYGRFIGCSRSGGECTNGIVDEFRTSDIVRSDAWIKATYNSLWDTLLTYSAEETKPSGVNSIFFGSNF